MYFLFSFRCLILNGSFSFLLFPPTVPFPYAALTCVSLIFCKLCLLKVYPTGYVTTQIGLKQKSSVMYTAGVFREFEVLMTFFMEEVVQIIASS